MWKFSAHKPSNLETLRSQASKFGNFQFTSPPFQRQVSVRKPHTLEIRAAHPCLKKSWVPPPRELNVSKIFQQVILALNVIHTKWTYLRYTFKLQGPIWCVIRMQNDKCWCQKNWFQTKHGSLQQWHSQPSLSGGAKWRNLPDFCFFCLIFPHFLYFFPIFPIGPLTPSFYLFSWIFPPFLNFGKFLAVKWALCPLLHTHH